MQLIDGKVVISAEIIGAAGPSGGDTDTLACIAGTIVGARCGRSALTERWIAGLDVHAADVCARVSAMLA